MKFMLAWWYSTIAASGICEPSDKFWKRISHWGDRLSRTVRRSLASFVLHQKIWYFMLELKSKDSLIWVESTIAIRRSFVTYRRKGSFDTRSVSQIIKKHCEIVKRHSIFVTLWNHPGHWWHSCHQSWK